MSERLVSALRNCENLHTMQGVSDADIQNAQDKLGVSFAPEYYEYLKEFGVASIKSHEFTGLGSSKRLSVIDNTMEERELHPGLLDTLYVVEEGNIDGIVVLQAPDSKVYEIGFDERIRLICNNLVEYIGKE